MEGDISLSGRTDFVFRRTDFPIGFGSFYNVSSVIVDDDELEEDEGFILYFDISDNRNNPLDLDRLRAGNRSILVTIIDIGLFC